MSSDRRLLARLAVAAVAIAVVAGLLVVARAGGTVGGTGRFAAGSGLAGPPAAAASFTPTDVAWLQLTIPMNDQMITLLALVPRRSTDPEVRRLAAAVSATHRAELRRMRELLRGSGVQEQGGHDGMAMPGMLTPAELDLAARLTGTAFDALVVRGLRDCSRQSVLVANGEWANGSHPDVRALAAQVAAARTADLAALAPVDHRLPGP